MRVREWREEEEEGGGGKRRGRNPRVLAAAATPDNLWQCWLRLDKRLSRD